MRALVVGAGITGCMAALRLRDLGCAVVLQEQSDGMGGVLRDWQASGFTALSGCQYLDPKAPWLMALRPALGDALLDFDHDYGSWTSCGGSSAYFRGIAAPVLPHDVPVLPRAWPPASSLQDRFDLYGQDIAGMLSAWAWRFGSDPALLDQSCAIGIQLSEICLQAHQSAVQAAKGQSAVADQLLALPRTVRDPGAMPLRATIPRHGYNHLFGALRQVLLERGVDVRLQSPVTPKADGGAVAFFSRGQRLDCDIVVWCGSPVPLAYAGGLGKLDNPSPDMVHVHGRLEGGLEVSPFYVQCYADASALYRLYVYPLDGQAQICLECIGGDGFALEAVLADAQAVLGGFGLDAGIGVVGLERRKSHALYTLEDVARVRCLEETHCVGGLISGAWTAFGRDEKIRRIFADIDQRLA